MCWLSEFCASFCFLFFRKSKGSQQKQIIPKVKCHFKAGKHLKCYLLFICTHTLFSESVRSQPRLCLVKQNLMDLRSLQHIVSLTSHDRTNKLFFHPHRTTKPPTVSSQFEVCLLYNCRIFLFVFISHNYIYKKKQFVFDVLYFNTCYSNRRHSKS